MNKKTLSIVIIAMTIITICIMILMYNVQRNFINTEDKTLILNSKEGNSYSDNSTKAPLKESIEGIESDRNNSLNRTDDKGNSENYNNNLSKSVKEQDKKDDSYINENKTIDNGKKSYKIENKDNVQVFKVSKENMLSQLSVSDKLKIFSISKNLSSGDLNRLQDDMNNKDERKGVSDAMQLLKLRLDNKDFNSARDIASKFINLERIYN